VKQKKVLEEYIQHECVGLFITTYDDNFNVVDDKIYNFEDVAIGFLWLTDPVAYRMYTAYVEE